MCYVKCTLKRDQNSVIMQISDNGEGIDEQHLDKIFTMFYSATTSSVGTGLGLYICKEIANKLMGSLNAESQLGKGTKMTITIPDLRAK